jgi:hypothetical protein
MNKLAAFGLGPAVFLVEAGLSSVGMRRVNGIGVGWMRRVRRVNGVVGTDRGASESKRESGGKDKSLRGNHTRRCRRRVVNPA